MDIETIAVAALPGLIFGGINIAALIKFSFGLGTYQGQQDAKGQSITADLHDIKSDIAEIRTETRAANTVAVQNFQRQELEMQANTILLKYLQNRDKELGERTHKIANLEQGMIGLKDEIDTIKRQLERRP